MSAIQSTVSLEKPAGETGRGVELSRRATLYFWLVVGGAVAVAVPFVPHLKPGTNDWAMFAVLGVCVAVAQIFVVVTPANQSYHATGVFLIPAALLLPPALVALIAIVMHVPDWLKRRLPFYIQAFNIANYTIATMGAWATAHLILGRQAFGASGVTTAIAGAAACVVFVALNHALLAQMLYFARGHSLRESSLFTFENLSTDLVLASLGVGSAALWHYNPWITPFALAPLVLIHRSLAVPALQAEARVDAKTGLFNARQFALSLEEELARAIRFNRPLSLIMVDLDLLRDINNTHGHLAGDIVLAGVADAFREELREYDAPARFGGEEFAILLPETTAEEAMEIAERIRRRVAAREFVVETTTEPVRATISLGVAAYPRDGRQANELVHQADLAVYRAKLQGRNRSLDASSEPLLSEPERPSPRLLVLPGSSNQPIEPAKRPPESRPTVERRANPRPRPSERPRLLMVGGRLAVVVAVVGTVGMLLGVLAAVFGVSTDVAGLVAIVMLVGLGQTLSLDVQQTGTISLSAVGALAGAAIIGVRGALVIAITMSAIEWSARRSVFHQVFFNVGTLTLASLAAAGVFALPTGSSGSRVVVVATGLAAGLVYFAVDTGLVAVAVGLDAGESVWQVWRQRFSWLTRHYIVYGFIAAVIYEAYRPLGIWALAVFAAPLLLMRKAQEDYLEHTEASTQKLRLAAETIQSQNAGLDQANRLLKERSTAAMESLTATVDARDAYTAGHSRRVQELALAMGNELGLSQTELELLGHAAFFHDIGKLAVPDAILLKPAQLTETEWQVMTTHSEEGASIINRLGFLNDAVPAIRHHHERFDGKGYPDALTGDEIPLGARIIHVADAFDSMLSNRVYRSALPVEEALAELLRHSEQQFCPRCVSALEAVVAADGSVRTSFDAVATASH